MIIPDVLALDFDGVLCDGMREYFETSRRTYAKAWPEEPAPGEDLLPAFRRLRPVILSGWEMPLLVRAIILERPEAAILANWAAVRDEVAASSPRHGDALIGFLKTALDQVRRDWIAGDRRGWLGLNVPYCGLDEVRRLVAEPERAVVVTTKEGEFTRLVLDDWQVRMADVQGKETGSHKCDNLRALIAAYQTAHGRRPRLAFVEDRLETLEHVTTHPDLEDVSLFLAAWGYNTPETRAATSAAGGSACSSSISSGRDSRPGPETARAAGAQVGTVPIHGLDPGERAACSALRYVTGITTHPDLEDVSLSQAVARASERRYVRGRCGVTKRRRAIRAKSSSRDHGAAFVSVAIAAMSRSATPNRWPASPAASIQRSMRSHVPASG